MQATLCFMHKCHSTLNTLSLIANQSVALPLAMRFLVICLYTRIYISSNQRLVECIGYIQEADFQHFAIVGPRSLKRIRQGQNKDLSNSFISSTVSRPRGRSVTSHLIRD